MIIGSCWSLTQSAARISEITGISPTVAGTLLVAGITSLLELLPPWPSLRFTSLAQGFSFSDNGVPFAGRTRELPRERRVSDSS